MNVFVLCTGRCGSVTFVRACRHITNYTSGHETRTSRLGNDRVAYPPNHIEADNRLTWFLGRLETAYGADAFYVHLRRDPDATARSYAGRTLPGQIINAYRHGILVNVPRRTPIVEICADYCRTVNENIRAFLAGKPHTMTMALEEAPTRFAEFWQRIGAEGDMSAALGEWRNHYHATPHASAPKRLARKVKRVVRDMPAFIRNA